MTASSFSRARRNASVPSKRRSGGSSARTATRIACAARSGSAIWRPVMERGRGPTYAFRIGGVCGIALADRMRGQEIGPERARRDRRDLDAQRGNGCARLTDRPSRAYFAAEYVPDAAPGARPAIALAASRLEPRECAVTAPALSGLHRSCCRTRSCVRAAARASRAVGHRPSRQAPRLHASPNAGRRVRRARARPGLPCRWR
jgi:hypothetical protein